MRLLGVVIGPQTREAVLAERSEAGRAITVQDGASVDDFTLKVVDAETVQLVAPSGVQTLLLEDHPGPRGLEVSAPPTSPRPQPASIESATKASGAEVGRLAIERDACARAGRLPGVSADAELRLRQVIGAIANLPGRPEGDITRNAPTKLIAFQMNAGLAEAHRQSAGVVLDLGGCRDMDARWKLTAGSYGVP